MSNSNRPYEMHLGEEVGCWQVWEVETAGRARRSGGLRGAVSVTLGTGCASGTASPGRYPAAIRRAHASELQYSVTHL